VDSAVLAFSHVSDFSRTCTQSFLALLLSH
jgi:hypothetical protein